MSFSSNLKVARLAKGYTQQDIADMMGITKSTYCGYETGKRQPDVAKIKQLSALLGVSADKLLETTHILPTIAPTLTQDQQTLLSLFNALNAEGQEKLLDSADDLVQSNKYKKYHELEMDGKEA